MKDQPIVFESETQRKMVGYSEMVGGLALLIAILMIIGLLLFNPLLDLIRVIWRSSDTFTWNRTVYHLTDAMSRSEAILLLIIDNLEKVTLIVILLMAHRFFRNITTRMKPFQAENAAIIKRMSVVIIVYLIAALAINIGGNVYWAVVNSRIGEVAGALVGVTTLISLKSMAVPAIFLCLAKIFEYGTKLQQESDETL